jgi:hypothetical protein
MFFEHPAILYGLFLLGIPILIHFLNFRKSRTVFFSSLRFIEEIQSTNRNRRNLQDLLLLLLRLLIFSLVILAFAQPVIHEKQAGQSKQSGILAIYIDNTPSMELTGDGQVLLAMTKVQAREIIESFPPGNRYMILSGDANSTGGLILDRDQSIQYVDNLGISPSFISIGQTIEALLNHLSTENLDLSGLFIISDFQKNLFSDPIPSGGEGIPVFLIPIQTGVRDNISIDTCWFDNPLHQTGQQEVLTAKINNRSNLTFNDFPVRLEINDTLRAEINISLPSRSSVPVQLPFNLNSRGWQKGIVKIYDYPVPFDNELYFSYKIESSIPVLHLYEKSANPFLVNLFGKDPYFDFDDFSLSGFPRSDFKDYKLLILSGIEHSDESLIRKTREFLQSGGTVWFLPATGGPVGAGNSLLQSLGLPILNNIVESPVESKSGPGQESWLKSVMLNADGRLRMPMFQKYASQAPTNLPSSEILVSLTGEPLITRFQVLGGNFVLSTFSLDRSSTDLVIHPVLIPLSYLIGSLSLKESAVYETLGDQKPLNVKTDLTEAGEPVKLTRDDPGFEMIPIQQPGNGPETTIYTGSLPLAGFYTLRSGETNSGVLAFNIQRSESLLDFYADTSILDQFGRAGWKSVYMGSLKSEKLENDWKTAISGKNLWPLLLLLSLILLVLESFVINRKK